MLCGDIYRIYLDPQASDKRMLMMSRAIIFVILAGALLLISGNMGAMILNWSYLSMGLRGTVAFAPLCAALFLPGRIPARYALAAMGIGPLLILIGSFILPAGVDPLFLGMAGSLLIMGVGIGRSRLPYASSNPWRKLS
ncbi:MAG: hypothetical protein LBE84_04125 [Planctomycetota bacterium]|jgi:SSS family solute:Na+ symporter|nr:hypothetical protein [Planctomycetota bacterium]